MNAIAQSASSNPPDARSILRHIRDTIGMLHKLGLAIMAIAALALAASAQTPSLDGPMLPLKLMECRRLDERRRRPGAWNFIQVASWRSRREHHPGAPPRRTPDHGIRSSGNSIRSWGDECSAGKSGGDTRAHWTIDKSHYSAVYGPAGCSSCGAHSIRLDPQGNICRRRAPATYLQDEPEWKELMRLGTRVSPAEAQHFNMPTDVAFSPDGRDLRDRRLWQRTCREVLERRKIISCSGPAGERPGEFGLPHNLGDRFAGPGVRHRIATTTDRVFDAKGKF